MKKVLIVLYIIFNVLGFIGLCLTVYDLEYYTLSGNLEIGLKIASVVIDIIALSWLFKGAYRSIEKSYLKLIEE